MRELARLKFRSIYGVDFSGDALDAVIAALGVSHAWRDADHQFIARHARYRREGRLYV
jgi:hypothetical protein